MPEAEAEEGRLHGFDLATQIERGAARQMLGLFGHDLFDFVADAAEIAAVDIGIDIEHGPDVVVVDDDGRDAAFDGD